MARHPVDRAISYYYQRCYNSTGSPFFNITLNSLLLEDFKSFVLGTRHGYFMNGSLVIVDDGIQDASCRAIINQKVTTGLHHINFDFPSILTLSQHHLALNNIEKCIVGLQEQWNETIEVLNYWFPWLNRDSKQSKIKEMSFNGKKETIDTLRDDFRYFLEEQNLCDIKLYNQMKILFQQQMNVIKDQTFLFTKLSI